MSTEFSRKRALRYRELALAEADKEKIDLLNRIADEAERGVLCTVDRIFWPPTSTQSLRGLGA